MEKTQVGRKAGRSKSQLLGVVKQKLTIVPREKRNQKKKKEQLKGVKCNRAAFICTFITC